VVEPDAEQGDARRHGTGERGDDRRASRTGAARGRVLTTRHASARDPPVTP
jgi:hypothetical protein